MGQRRPPKPANLVEPDKIKKKTGRPKGAGLKKPMSQRVIMPIQARVLDALHSPQCSTIDEVAKLAHVGPETIRRWLDTHELFRNEYLRRVQVRGDEVAALAVEGVRLAQLFYIKVVKNEEGKYSVAEQMRAASALLEFTRRHDTLININTSAPSPAPVVSATQIEGQPPSVVRLQRAGMSQSEARQVEYQELRLLLARGAALEHIDGLPAEPNVIDGDCHEQP